jgi:membrane fusion protein (multidrug efflux system)
VRKLANSVTSWLTQRFTPAQLRLTLFALGPLAVLAILGAVWLSGGHSVSTDDAYVKAGRVQISAEVEGRVVAVLVHENEHVSQGTPLFEIDNTPFEIAVDRAKADLLEAQSSIEAARARYRETQAKLEQAKADLEFAERELARQTKLAESHVASAAKLDAAKQARAQAEQGQVALWQEQQALLAELGGDAEAPTETHPRYLSALAMLDKAELDLARTTVVAPAAGLVSQIDNFRPGAYVRPGTPVFSLVEIEKIWVEANLKETQLTRVQPGQPARVRVDAYPGHVWQAHVDSVGAGTGAEFALLPPQNATGNWVKITQRVPVRLAIDRVQGEPPLRLGMSAQVVIDTGRTPASAAQALAGTPTSGQ